MIHVSFKTDIFVSGKLPSQNDSAISKSNISSIFHLTLDVMFSILFGVFYLAKTRELEGVQLTFFIWSDLAAKYFLRMKIFMPGWAMGLYSYHARKQLRLPVCYKQYLCVHVFRLQEIWNPIKFNSIWCYLTFLKVTKSWNNLCGGFVRLVQGHVLLGLLKRLFRLSSWVEKLETQGHCSKEPGMLTICIAWPESLESRELILFEHLYMSQNFYQFA